MPMKRRWNLVLLGLLACGAAWANPEAVREITEGVESFAKPGIPGPVALLSPDAFPVVMAKDGSGVAHAVVGAAEYGAGRVVVFGHGGYLGEPSAENRKLLSQAVRWAAQGQGRVGVQGGTAVEGTPLEGDWTAALSGFDALVITRPDALSEAEISRVQRFVEGGGGLITAHLGWGWLQLNPGKTLDRDFAANALLRPMGLALADGYLDSIGPIASDATTGNAAKALDILASGGGDKQTAATVMTALRTIPAEHLLTKQLQELVAGRGAPVPTPQSPLSYADPLGMIAITLAHQRGDGDVADPSAAAFPGLPPADAERVSATVEVAVHKPHWQSTGLYAAAGEDVVVTLPEGWEGRGLKLQIGAHNSQLWHLDSWRRHPDIVRQYALDRRSVTVRSPFGGLVYVVVPEASAQHKIAVTIAGAVQAPRYVRGKTPLKTWREEIRNYPGPWAELEGERIILTVPSSVAARLDQPDELMRLWDEILDFYCDLGMRALPDRPERIVSDEQIGYGYMYAGYPIMTHLDAATFGTDVEFLTTKGSWGHWHELGHNHQQDDWTFDGTVEVTVNLFTLYVYERLLGQEPAEAMLDRNIDVAGYMAAGADFERWKRDPFLALSMYVQLQEAFGWEAFQKVFAEYRDLPQSERPRSDAEKRDQWMVRFSRAIGRDLGPFFARWGVPVSEAARAQIADLPDWMPESLQ